MKFNSTIKNRFVDKVIYKRPKRELPRLKEIEKYSEAEFIDFAKKNHGYYDQCFHIEGIGGNRLLLKLWSTDKYYILSECNDDDYTDYITITRINDNQCICDFVKTIDDEDDFEYEIESNEDSSFLFFDTETTGLPKDWDAPASNVDNWPRLVQIGWVLYDKLGNLILEDKYIIKPVDFSIPTEASNVHGITTEIAIKEGVNLHTVIEKFLDLVNDSDVLIGHNIQFDQNVIGAELIRNGFANSLETKKKFCTMKSTINFCRIDGPYGYKWPKLIELYNILFSKGFNQHDALDDVKATAACYWELKRREIF